MSRAVAWTAAIAGGAATVAAMALPWARYGGISIGLNRLPGWGFYVAAAVALNLVVGWALLRRSNHWRLPLLAEAALCAGTVGAAVAVMLRYDDAEAIFGPVVPLVFAVLGPGGPVAIVAALAGGTALALAPRTHRSGPTPSPHTT